MQRDSPLDRRGRPVAGRLHRRRAGGRAARRLPARANRVARQQQIGRRADRCGQGRGRSRRGGLDDRDRATRRHRGRGGRRPGRAGPRHRRRRGAHPRVHLHRPRRPEVRAVAGQRRGDGTRCGGCSPPITCDWSGLHSHIGSQIFDVGGFEIAAHRVIGLLRDVVAEFGVDKTAQISTVDLGGGLGISYLPNDDPPPVAELADKLSAIVQQRVRGGGSAGRHGWWSSPAAPSPDRGPSRSTRSAPSRTSTSARRRTGVTSASTAA